MTRKFIGDHKNSKQQFALKKHTELYKDYYAREKKTNILNLFFTLKRLEINFSGLFYECSKKKIYEYSKKKYTFNYRIYDYTQLRI